MNYIKQLETDLWNARHDLDTMREAMREFNVFLQSPKFTGTESNGDRKDWIATGDVRRWIADTLAATEQPVLPELVNEELLACCQWVALNCDRWARNGIARGPEGKDADWYQRMKQLMDTIQLAEGRAAQ